MKKYHLPDFHLTWSFWAVWSLPFNPVQRSMVASGPSCQLIGRSGRAVVIKLPKGTNLPTANQKGLPVRKMDFNVPDGSNDWYEQEDYGPVALGYDNEHEEYSVVYDDADGFSVLPHS